jgi:hypothetical protein
MINENYYQKDLKVMKIERLNRQRIELLIRKARRIKRNRNSRGDNRFYFLGEVLII